MVRSNVLGAILLFVLSLGVFGQEVIMNAPSADVPNQGHLFLRADSFYTQHPAYFSENSNFAFGVGHGLELSINQTDLNHDVTYVVPGFKWQVVKNKSFTVFVGDQVTAPINGKNYGNNAYEAVAWTKGNFRLTGGVFQSFNAVQEGNRAGALGGVEWTAKSFKNGWSLAPGIDWSSGAGTNGYTSVGLSFMKKSFFACPGYMIANPNNPNGAHQSFVMIGLTL